MERCPPVFHPSMMCVSGKRCRTPVCGQALCGVSVVPVCPCGRGGTHVYAGVMGVKRPPSPGPAVGAPDRAVLSCLREWQPPCQPLGPPYIGAPGLAFVSFIGGRKEGVGALGISVEF